MQNVIEIQMLNGAKMPIKVEVKTDFYGVRTVSRIFGQYFQLMVQGGNMCIYIQPKQWLAIKNELAAILPAVSGCNPKSPLAFRISDEEKAAYEIALEAIKAPAQAEFDAVQAAQPRKFCRWDFFDMGDYSITYERRIYKMRLENTGWVIEETIANLDNAKIGEYREEWDEMIGEEMQIANYIVKGIEVTEEEAMFWAGVEKGEILKEEAKKEEAAAKIREAAEASTKIEAAKFDEAKATGKPVILNSCFLIGDDIPRKYMPRDIDSDMGHLQTWAMPDGTTKETFSHAY